MEFGLCGCSFDYYGLELIPAALLIGIIFLPLLYVTCYLPFRIIVEVLSYFFERFTWESAAIFEASEYVLEELCKTSGRQSV